MASTTNGHGSLCSLSSFCFDTRDVYWQDFITTGCYYKLLDVNEATRAVKQRSRIPVRHGRRLFIFESDAPTEHHRRRHSIMIGVQLRDPPTYELTVARCELRALIQRIANLC